MPEMNKEEVFKVRIPKEKRKFYSSLQVSREIRELIKVLNYWQKKAKWSS